MRHENWLGICPSVSSSITESERSFAIEEHAFTLTICIDDGPGTDANRSNRAA